MEKYNWSNTITINPAKFWALPFGKNNKSYQQGYKKKDKHKSADKTPFFTNGAKNKIGTLLWDKIEFSLCPFQETLTIKTTGANRNFRLVDIIPGAMYICFLTN